MGNNWVHMREYNSQLPSDCLPYATAMWSALDALSYLIPTATSGDLGTTIILNFTDEGRVLARLNNMHKVTSIVSDRAETQTQASLHALDLSPCHMAFKQHFVKSQLIFQSSLLTSELLQGRIYFSLFFISEHERMSGAEQKLNGCQMNKMIN